MNSPNPNPNITFSTSWYEFKAKFDHTVYYKWIDNMLSNVKNYNLVIYSDETSSICLQKYLNNPRIKLIVRPLSDFYYYIHKEFFIDNHAKNNQLNKMVDWRVNMLWCEKIPMVYETMSKKYFDTEFYGWCDIGYFREPSREWMNWPSPEKITSLDPQFAYYACINNNVDYMIKLRDLILNKNSLGLPIVPIPPNQLSVAGGFFVTHRDNIAWWMKTFDDRLELYIDNDYLVKDDQMIIIDCIFSNPSHFKLITERNNLTDSVWFLFQRYLANDV
jgi:hypothetical protein